MSLINDALRRAARPAATRNRERDRADVVIAALGYAKQKRRGREWIPLAAGALLVVGLGAWVWWGREARGAKSEVRGARIEGRGSRVEDRGPRVEGSRY